MTHIINDTNTNHPCYGMNCNECETCKFDRDLFIEPKKSNQHMNNYDSCEYCGNLIKNYIGEERLKFNACCGRMLIDFGSTNRPRIIKANTGPMLPLPTPDWCPKKRGITKEYLTASELQNEVKSLPSPNNVSTANSNTEINKPMTYSERREKMMQLPKHIEWDDIEEGGVYVIPKILHQSRKVIRVVIKTESLLRCSEIDEYGKESQALTSVYPRDIDMVFITKVLKY